MPDPNSYEAIGWLLLALAALATAINQVKQLFGGNSAATSQLTNDPLNVRINREWATAHEVEGLRAEVRTLSQQLSALPNQMAESSEGRLRGLREQITACQTAIQNMPAQVISMLRNAGALPK